MTEKLNKIRVISVIPGSDEGSSMIFCRRVNDAISNFGVEVFPFYLKSRTTPYVIFKERARLRQIIKEINPNIIHAQYGTMTSFFCTLTSLLPLIITFRGSDLNPTPSLNPMAVGLKNWMSQISAWRAKVSICVSKELGQRVTLGADRVVILPSGVNTEVFHPMARDDARRQLGWADEPVVLFYGGRHPLVKRLDLAESALKIVKQHRSNARLFNMDGGIDPDLIPVYMGASDCFLLTSDYEGSPTVVQEAKACNLPVVSVSVGDVEDQLKNVQMSRIVDRNPEVIAHALLDIIDSGSRSDGSLHLEKVSLEYVGAETVRIYKKVLGLDTEAGSS